MQIHAALRLVRERPKADGLPTVKIQFRGVLQAQHDRVRCHPLLGLPPVRLQYRAPVDFVVVEEAVRRDRLAPAPTGLRHVGRRLGCQSFHQGPRSLVQTRVAKVEVGEFGFRPAGRIQEQGVHAKSKSKRDLRQVYKRPPISLKVNKFFRAWRLADRDVYNAMRLTACCLRPTGF
jgi:hypothetical protein